MLASAFAVLALAVGIEGPIPSDSTPIALVTAEQADLLLAVGLRSGRVRKRVAVPPDPENVIGGAGLTTVVVSPRAGAVTLLDWRTLRILRVLRGFGSPHLAAFSPDGEWAYVTDDGRGELDVIELARERVVGRVFVGRGAHHLTVSPRGGRVWVALGERARTLVVVNVSNRRRPRVLRRFDPGFTAHDLAFSPDGGRVWVTSSDGDDVTVLAAAGGRPLFRVPVGPPPQHLAFAGRFAYVTSGYGRKLEEVDVATGRVVSRRATPYGSFNVAAGAGLVVTSSLFEGTVSVFDGHLRARFTEKVASAARGVALTRWAVAPRSSIGL